jgi:succinoglycan biosynthesis protein ExoM
MNVPEDVDISVIIVDNDYNLSARETVEIYTSQCRFPVIYGIEKKRGIAFARNKVLSIAKQYKATELIFIDDDEYVDKQWLELLWNYYLTNIVDVIWGYVKTVYPENTPKWIVDGSFYQLPKLVTGQRYYTAYSGNVLFNFQKLVIDYKLSFDETFDAFGEDEDFFTRSASKGAIIHFLAEAIVYEELDYSRMNARYYFKRLFINKNNQRFLKNNGSKFKLGILRSGILDVFRGIYYLISVLLIWKKYRIVLGMGYFVSAFAKISGFFGVYFNVKHR